MTKATLFPLFLSNTDLSLWSQCELRWFRTRAQWLRKTSFNIDLSAGGAFASAIEMARKRYHNDKVDPEQAVEEAMEYVLETLHDAEFQDDLKSPERMSLAVKDYFNEFPLATDEVKPLELEDGLHAIEHKFSIELPINHPELGVPLIFKGKLDMLGEFMGRNYVVDEKTCKMFPKNDADLLAMSGQFIGYCWAARKKGIKTVGALVRKVAIQKAGNKIAQVEIPITDYMIDLWEGAMLSQVNSMVDKYSLAMGNPDLFKHYFVPDLQSGCTSYYRPCPFKEGCSSEYGERFIDAEFNQIAFDPEERVEIELESFMGKLGLVQTKNRGSHETSYK